MWCLFLCLFLPQFPLTTTPCVLTNQERETETERSSEENGEVKKEGATHRPHNGCGISYMANTERKRKRDRFDCCACDWIILSQLQKKASVNVVKKNWCWRSWLQTLKMLQPGFISSGFDSSWLNGFILGWGHAISISTARKQTQPHQSFIQTWMCKICVTACSPQAYWRTAMIKLLDISQLLQHLLISLSISVHVSTRPSVVKIRRFSSKSTSLTEVQISNWLTRPGRDTSEHSSPTPQQTNTWGWVIQSLAFYFWSHINYHG